MKTDGNEKVSKIRFKDSVKSHLLAMKLKGKKKPVKKNDCDKADDGEDGE